MLSELSDRRRSELHCACPLLERIGGHGKFDTIASAHPIICEKTVCQRATGIMT
jgi:hypothetical protein